MDRVLHKATYPLRHPVRVWNRITWDAQIALRPLPRERVRFFRFLERHFGVDAAALRAEYRASAFAREYAERKRALEDSSRLRSGTTSDFDCEALYLWVRALRPRVIVETGVLYGASSAHFLAALRANGAGTLYSLDLPNEPGEPPQDFLVPDDLAEGWELVLGDIRETLPPLLARLGEIDLFHHDSWHAFEHQGWEYETAWPGVSPAGTLSSHNVIHPWLHRNAFRRFTRARGLRCSIFRNVGIVAPGQVASDLSHRRGPPKDE